MKKIMVLILCLVSVIGVMAMSSLADNSPRRWETCIEKFKTERNTHFYRSSCSEPLYVSYTVAGGEDSATQTGCENLPPDLRWGEQRLTQYRVTPIFRAGCAYTAHVCPESSWQQRRTCAAFAITRR